MNMMSNEKKQTTMQVLIYELISRREHIIKNSSNMTQDMLEGGVMAFESAIDLAQSLLEMENEQIVNAVDGFPIKNRNLEGKDYYNETFKQQDNVKQ
jgi:hypothetical protein